jgi:hypothetical protein
MIEYFRSPGTLAKPLDYSPNAFWGVEFKRHLAVLVEYTRVLDPEQMLGQRRNGLSIEDCTGDPSSMATRFNKVGHLICRDTGKKAVRVVACDRRAN